MSIQNSIAAALSTGRLHAFELEFASDELVRSILLHPQFAADLSERVEEWGWRVGQLQTDFESFVKGEYISLSMTPFKHRTATMGLMAPKSDGTWEIRCREPRPGLRVLGKFASVDTFVALSWEPRSVKFGRKNPLGDKHSREYRHALSLVNKRWNHVLPRLSSLTGGNYSDYVSKNCGQG